MKSENMNYSLLVYLIRHVEDSFGQLVHGPINKQSKFSLLAVKYSKSEHTDYVNYTHQLKLSVGTRVFILKALPKSSHLQHQQFKLTSA